MYCLTAISVKEALVAGITKLVGADVTNPIIRTADGTDFKTVNEYSIASFVKAIINGADRLEATNICRQYVSLAATQFDFRERLSTNVERFVIIAAKSTSYGVKVHDDTKAAMIMANVKRAAQ